MAEERIDMNNQGGNARENRADHAESLFRTPPKRHAHDGLPNATSRESSLRKKKIASVLASTKRKLDAAGSVKSKRNLLVDFEACRENSEGQETKKDQQLKTGTKIRTVTILKSPNRSPNASTSKAASSVIKVPQRQLPERSNKPDDLELNESALCLKNLKKAIDELDNIEVMKIYQNNFVRRRKSNPQLKRLQSKPKTKKTWRRSTGSTLGAYRTSSNTSISSTASSTSSCKTYYYPEAENYFDECPDIFLRDDFSALDWDIYLKEEVNWGRLHSVEAFPFAPLKDVFAKWAKVGLAVEVPNLFAEQDDNNNFPYWCGTIIHFAGYKAVIQLQDLGTLESEQERKKYRVYLSLFCGKVKPLNWSSRCQLDPGPVVAGSIKSATLASKLEAFYSTSPTINDDMMNQVNKASSNQDHLALEGLDLIKYSGDRFHVAKISNDINNRSPTAEPLDYLSHYKNRNVLPFLHGAAIGITAPRSSGTSPKRFKPMEPSADMFPQVPKGLEIKLGMKLELININMPYVLIVAKITKIHNYGYFEVKTGGSKSVSNFRRVYHVTDPHVLPVGFAAKYGMPLIECPSLADNPALDLSLLPPRPPHTFDIGDKFEAVSLVAPDFIGPVTVVAKSDHLVCVHFDGWSYHPINYQWMDPLEDEIYPSGYCETFGIEWKGNVSMDV